MNGPWLARAVVAVAGLAATSLVAPPLSAQSLYEQARAAQQRNQLDSAYELIQRAAEAEPNRAEVQALLGDMACSKAGRVGGLGAFGPARTCKAAYSRAVELAPDSLSYLESLAQYLSQAPGIAGGDRDSALGLARHIQRLDDVRGTFLMAGLLWRGNEAEKARADSLVDASGRSRAGDRANEHRVAAYWASTNRPERALVVYERLVAGDSRDPVAHFGVGRALVLLKREPRRAQEHLRLAAAAPQPPGTGPSFVPGAPWYRLGQTYVQLGMPDSARVCFEQALRVNPQLTNARAALDSLPHP
jgi:tetratricopeptide (TPR) repeat protein